MTATLVPIAKIITEQKDGFHVWSHDHSKHLGGPYATKVQAQRRLRQVEHFKEQDAKNDKKKEVAKVLDHRQAQRWAAELRKQYNPNQPREKNGRFARIGGSGGAAAVATARAAGRAVRGKVNVKNAKKVARGAVNISKPIIKMVGKAAFAGAMAGLVMGVEHTFSSAGSDVGRAAGATAAAAAKELQQRAETKAGMFVTARVRNKGGGNTGVSVQGAQRVSNPSASHFDLGATAPRSSGSGPTGSISVSPFMVHNSNMFKTSAVNKAGDFSDDDTWVVMALEEFDAKQFGDAVAKECGRLHKRAAFFA